MSEEEKWYYVICCCCGEFKGVTTKPQKNIFVCKDCVLKLNKAVILEKICIVKSL